MKILISLLLISSLGFIPNELDLQSNEVALEGCWVKTEKGLYHWYPQLTCQDFITDIDKKCFGSSSKEIPISEPNDLSKKTIKFELRDDGNGGSIVWDLDR
ncbi:MAG: hypothetical protein ACPG19_08875 [Saprospiraceae bacterium]